ncbi:hypothetical protein KSS87_012727 [Heliosperma pusillum]|nr:hypothetical protein KSS87_012727 [Heliosperma pusillum]
MHSEMHKAKKRNIRSPEKSVSWLNSLNGCLLELVIPLGPRFQADVPEWECPSNEASPTSHPDTSKWLGTKIWPLKDENTLKEGDKIGKGRSDSCTCPARGSAQCIRKHVSEARKRLQFDLGPAYKSWKFDEMGEDVGKSWTPKQKTKFDYLVKINPLSEDKSFLKSAERYFHSKTRKDIVSYYLNVYVPNRIRMLTSSGCKVVDSDDDQVVEVTNAVNPLKRSRPNHVDVTQLVRSHYLTGKR